MENKEIRQICPPRKRPLTSKERKMMEDFFAKTFKEDDCHE